MQHANFNIVNKMLVRFCSPTKPQIFHAWILVWNVCVAVSHQVPSFKILRGHLHYYFFLYRGANILLPRTRLSLLWAHSQRADSLPIPSRSNSPKCHGIISTVATVYTFWRQCLSYFTQIFVEVSLFRTKYLCTAKYIPTFNILILVNRKTKISYTFLLTRASFLLFAVARARPFLSSICKPS